MITILTVIVTTLMYIVRMCRMLMGIWSYTDSRLHPPALSLLSHVLPRDKVIPLSFFSLSC